MLLPSPDVAAARLPFGSASTLPALAYSDPAVFEAEIERIFRREWLCVARTDQVSAPGDYLTVELLDQPLVVTRDESGELHVLSRVCRHRGAVIVEGAGNARTLRCPYHAWVYRLDGTLAGAPHAEGASGFAPERCALPELRSEVWEGFVFASLDPNAAPLGSRLATLSRVLSRYRLDEFVTSEPMVFDSGFNWKILIDNFMEAYHHIATHRDTLEPLFPAQASYTLESDGPWSLLVMPPRGAKRSDDPADWPEESLVAGCVFPSHLFAPAPSVLSWYQILPEAPGRFTIRVYACPSRAASSTPEAEAMRAFIRQVHLQDIDACEATWAGLQAPCYRAGLIAPLEQALWQFSQWWLARMGA